ncbi:MAG: DUF5372 family protein [Nocardioidaceae bacterium]
MTHRFHPLRGRRFEFVVQRQNWGEDRVHLRDADGRVFSVPTGWTDAAPPDAFVVVAAGRCRVAVRDLLVLADLIDRLRASADETRM